MDAPSAASSLPERWIQFSKNLDALDDGAKKFKEAINSDYSTLDGLVKKLKESTKELSMMKSLVKASPASPDQQSQLQQMSEAQRRIDRLVGTLVPKTGSLFVRLFLGKVNVKQYRDGERFRLKAEYQKFKSKTDPLFLGFVVFQLVFPAYRSIGILFQAWLLYYYVTLALRENILNVNGSFIKPWWILHHYVSIAMSLTILTWPDTSESYKLFLQQFLYFSLLQGVVQILQSKYQSVKLYNLIAMGKADRMTVETESSIMLALSCTPGLTALFPFLLAAYFFQLYNSYELLRHAVSAYNSGLVVEWQVWACGVLFLALGLGNLGTTLQTYYQKWQEDGKKRH